MKKGVLLIFVIFFSSFTSAALGISPAFVDLDFKPGAEYSFDFNIISDDPDTELEISLDGDFSQYAKLDKTTITGSETVTVDIKLPISVEKPGYHQISLSAKEKIQENKFLGTTIDISVFIKFFVPYPGRFIDANLEVIDGNIDEEVKVELKVINRGSEDLDVDVYVDFFEENGNLVLKMPFQSVNILSSNERFFRKLLNTSEFKPGNYLAVGNINFGERVSVNSSFRIGSLNVDIKNFSEELTKGGIQKFHIDIESKWNNFLDEVYADVNITNGTKDVSFRTPSVDLDSWKKKTLEGFLDTTDLDGVYDVIVSLNYKSQFSVKEGTLRIIGPNYTKLIVSIVISIIAIILLIIIFLIRRRYKRKKRKKK